MSIEFECSSCQRLLRVPDNTEGELCECPACGVELTIPGPKSSAADSMERIQVRCPKCNHVLACARDLLGSKGQCKACQHIFTISLTPQAGGLPSHVFSCPNCSQLFEGNQEMQGRKGRCHTCGELFTIELRKLEAPKPLPRQSKPTATADDIQIQCSECNGIMEVPSSAAGRTTACPFCRQLLQIPRIS